MSKASVYVLSHNKLDDEPSFGYGRQTSQMSSMTDSSTYDKPDYK